MCPSPDSCILHPIPVSYVPFLCPTPHSCILRPTLNYVLLNHTFPRRRTGPGREAGPTLPSLNTIFLPEPALVDPLVMTEGSLWFKGTSLVERGASGISQTLFMCVYCMRVYIFVCVCTHTHESSDSR